MGLPWVPEKGCHAGIEKSLINIGGQAVDCWTGVNIERNKVKRKEKGRK